MAKFCPRSCWMPPYRIFQSHCKPLLPKVLRLMLHYVVTSSVQEVCICLEKEKEYIHYFFILLNWTLVPWLPKWPITANPFMAVDLSTYLLPYSSVLEIWVFLNQVYFKVGALLSTNKNPFFICVMSCFENQKNWWDSRWEKFLQKPSQFRQMQMALNLKLGVIQ